MKYSLIILVMIFTSCEVAIQPTEQVYYPEDLGGGVYYLVRSDKAITFQIDGRLHTVLPENYELLIFSAQARNYVKTSDFVTFKIFSNRNL